MAKAYVCDDCGELFVRSRDMKTTSKQRIVAILIFKRGNETPDICENCKQKAARLLEFQPVQLGD